MKRKPADILGMVEEHDSQTNALRERMDKDYRLLRLEPFKHEDLDSFRKFTHNEPRTQYLKIMSLMTTAKRHIQINQALKDRDERNVTNQAELFYIGNFRANDQRLIRMGHRKLQTGNSYYIAMRGFGMGRCILVKDRKDDHVGTFDITPFDPRQTFWEIGVNGPIWMIHRTWKSPRQIKDQFGVTLKAEHSPSDPKGGITTYEWFDNTHTGVVTARQVLKKPTEHGSPETPCYFDAVGPAPFIFSEAVNDTIKDWGESIFQSNREVWEELNYEQSIMSALIARSLKQPYVIESRDGSFTLDFNPWETGRETALQEGDKIIPLEQQTMAPEAGAMLGQVAGMAQRGGIPWSSFGGDLPAPISGFAIGQLRAGQSTPIEAPIETLTNVYMQIMRLMKLQYASGGFEVMEVSGRSQSGRHEFFKEKVPTEIIEEGGDPEITFTATLPQDDIQNAAMATQLTQPDANGQSMLPYRYARENILRIQDADRVGDELREQQAIAMSALAQARANMLAAIEIGDEDLAQIWLGEVQQQMIKEFGELQLLQPQASGIAQAASAGAQAGAQDQRANAQSPRFDPRTAPNSTVGAPPPTPTPQSGPNVPAGTPRRRVLLGPTGEPI